MRWLQTHAYVRGCPAHVGAKDNRRVKSVKGGDFTVRGAPERSEGHRYYTAIRNLNLSQDRRGHRSLLLPLCSSQSGVEDVETLPF